MNVLVTGANGFVGRHVVKRMRDTNTPFFTIGYRDFLDTGSLPDGDMDIVIHLAGLAHVIGDKTHTSYEDFYRANCEYALNLAKAAANRGVKRFVYVSTIGVYGRSSCDTQINERTEPNPVDFYSRSKLEGERQLQELSKELGFELVIVRPALVYGYDAPGNIRRILNLTAKLPFIPIAENNNKRSFIYVENLVDFILLGATHSNAMGMVFNIGDDSMSTRFLIASFAKGMGKKPVLCAASGSDEAITRNTRQTQALRSTV